MSEPVIARMKPCLVSVEQGKRYLWCACGRSNNQPFCDGSHKGTPYAPVPWKATEDGEKLFCACKRTRSQPFCDGTHNSLSDTYEEAEEGAGAGARRVDYETDARGASKAELDNGCYVIRVPDAALSSPGPFRSCAVIGPADGARHLSQYLATLDAGTSPILSYGDSDVVLFIASGRGSVTIGDRTFAVAPETGVCVKPGEGVQIHNDGPDSMSLSITVCPPCDAPRHCDTMPDRFDAAYPDRVQGVDESKQESMADRFYQVLVGEQDHGTPVTQFIGAIPRSRAAHHRHLYEETITVLSGEGYMWTDDTKTPVQPGDTIFLPLKQAHSLECTSAAGMRLIGHFYPSMSPAINY